MKLIESGKAITLAKILKELRYFDDINTELSQYPTAKLVESYDLLSDMVTVFSINDQWIGSYLAEKLTRLSQIINDRTN